MDSKLKDWLIALFEYGKELKFFPLNSIFNEEEWCFDIPDKKNMGYQLTFNAFVGDYYSGHSPQETLDLYINHGNFD